MKNVVVQDELELKSSDEEVLFFEIRIHAFAEYTKT